MIFSLPTIISFTPFPLNSPSLLLWCHAHPLCCIGLTRGREDDKHDHQGIQSDKQHAKALCHRIGRIHDAAYSEERTEDRDAYRKPHSPAFELEDPKRCD